MKDFEDERLDEDDLLPGDSACLDVRSPGIPVTDIGMSS
jgi:hypothetical protein